MASRVGVSRVLDEEDEDDDVADLFDEEFLEHMEALKQACQMMPGAEVRLKSTSNLAASKFDEEEYEEEGDGEVDDDDDDDALLLSIERKFLGKGGLVSGSGRSKAVPSKEKVISRAGNKDDERHVVAKNGGITGTGTRHSSGTEFSGVSQPVRSSALAPADGVLSDDDDEDEDLLKSVKESCGVVDLVKASKHSKTSFPDVEGCFSGDVEPISSSEGAERCSPDAGTVTEAQPICSFLPAQLSDDDFSESPLAIVVHQPNSVSNDVQDESRVPENVQAVSEALLRNRVCQQSLREVLRQVEQKLNENREMQRRAVSLVEYQKACTRKFCGFTEVGNASVELIASKPTCRRKAGEFKVKGPPENADVEVYRRLQSQLPAEFNVRKWTKKESEALAKGVRQQVQEIGVRAMMERWESDEEGGDFDEQMRNIGESEEEVRRGLPGVDWNEVARMYVSGRSGWECKLQWENNVNPVLNSKAWSKGEDKRLLSIVQAHDMVGWDSIAEELGTQRTAAQCAIRFQRSLNASILRSAWSPEEDEQLQAAVEKFGEKDWQSVAACMEGRLGSQCMSRWTKVLHPGRHRRGRWVTEEDTRLKWAVSVYGPRGWKNIASHVPGRSDVQCRERWCNVLDPSVRIDEWSPEEDAKLEELVAKHGRHRWAAVGAELGRTDNQCFRHWKLLHPEHKVSFKKDMVILRAALATNFVGREKERPELGFQDFLPPSGVGEEVDRRPLAGSGAKISREKVGGKARRASTKKKPRGEACPVVNEKLPAEREALTPEVPSVVTEVTESSGDVAEVGSRMSGGVEAGEREGTWTGSENGGDIGEDVGLARMRGAIQVGGRVYTRKTTSEVATSKVKAAPKASKRLIKKRKSAEPCSEVHENPPMEKDAPTPELPSTVTEINDDIVEVGSGRRRGSKAGARVSKKRKASELLPRAAVVEDDGDKVDASRDEIDPQVIVYTRRRNGVSRSCDKSFLDNGGAVGAEVWKGGGRKRVGGTGALAGSEEPTLKRQRKQLTLPNFLYSDSLI